MTTEAILLLAIVVFTITAFAREQDRDGAVHSFGGDPVTWTGVQALVEQAWPDGRPDRAHGGHASTLVPS